MIKYESDPDAMQVEIHPHKKSHSTKRNSKKNKSMNSDLIPMPQTIDNHPLESWNVTNPHRLPRYGLKSHNIFMQLQDEPLLGSVPGEPEDTTENISWNPMFFLSLPPPDDLPVDDNMAHFLSNRMDNFLGFQQCFSSAYKSLYLLSANSSVLRHTLFAFVKYLNEKDRVLQAALCNAHLSKAIPLLQASITSESFDDGQILSVPLLAYLAFWWRKPKLAKSHIRGFYKMLIHAGYLTQDQYGKVSVSDKMPSLVLLMWRVAVRLDHYFGFLNPEEETLPPIKASGESSRRYITDFIEPGNNEWVECLVLTDELEDLRNLAVHFNRRATQVRSSAEFNPPETQAHIERASKKVVFKIEKLEGRILTAAATYNAIYQPVFTPIWYQTLDPFPAGSFLHYPPLFKNLHNRFIEAIVVNRATLIHTMISAYPYAGPYPMERLQAAVEICCAFATLKERMPFALQGRGRLLEALLFAGYTFCTPDHLLGTYTLWTFILILEFQWIQKRLQEEAELGHSGATRMNQLLELSWKEPDKTCWEWAKITFSR